jgi:hypothetical protein
MQRPICPACGQRPCAINYKKDSVVHYRSRCQACVNKNRKIKAPEPRWRLAGYKKKSTCDKCCYKAKYTTQLLVHHIDGNLHNSADRNLRTICLNCSSEVKRSGLPWKPGDLEPDF